MKYKYQLYKHAWRFSENPQTERMLTSIEAKEILQQAGLLIRNTYDFDCKENTQFWFVIKDKFGELEELSTKTRNQVRHGLKNYHIRRIDTQELLESGYDIYLSAANSYRVKSVIPAKEDFIRIVKQENMEFWGAWNESNSLRAFAINKVNEGSYCDYQTLKAYPLDMKNYVYYALIYEMNRHYLQERNMLFVMDGARSITNHSNIQPFLEEKFHFRKAYCHLKIYYRWWFGWIVKILYPFKHLIKNNNIRAILEMHGMQG